MLVEFLNRLLDLKRPETVEIHGRVYSTNKLASVESPVAEAVSVRTLTGLVDLYRENLDNVKSMEIGIHVVSHDCVRLISLEADQWANRRTFIAAIRKEERGFPFGEWMGIEPFIIGLQAMFYPSAEQAQILALVSNMTAGSLATSEDDGFSQKVTVQKSVAFKEDRTIKPIVALQPYRTFSEVDQPVSNFLFRVRRNGENNQAVQCMLTEADGGLWKYAAMDSMKAWFKDQALNLPIIA